MGRQRVRVTKSREKKIPNGYEKCRICKGTGVQKKPNKKK